MLHVAGHKICLLFIYCSERNSDLLSFRAFSVAITITDHFDDGIDIFFSRHVSDGNSNGTSWCAIDQIISISTDMASLNREKLELNYFRLFSIEKVQTMKCCFNSSFDNCN